MGGGSAGHNNQNETYMEVESSRAVVPRRRGITSSERSKLKMPVKRMSFFAKKNGYATSVRIAGSVHMAGALEELAEIILAESWDMAKEGKSGSIRLKDFRRALEVDGDLRGLSRVLKTRICGGGVERTVRPKPSTDPIEVEKAKSDSKKRRKAKHVRRLRKEATDFAKAMGLPAPVFTKVPSTKAAKAVAAKAVAAKAVPHPFAAKTVAAKAATLLSLKGKNVASKVSTSAVLLGLKKKTPAEKTVAFLETADEEEDDEDEDEDEDEEDEEEEEEEEDEEE
jgi:hypothetical protein